MFVLTGPLKRGSVGIPRQQRQQESEDEDLQQQCPPPQGASAERLNEPLAKGRKKPWAKPTIIPITDGVVDTQTGPKFSPWANEGITYAS